MDRPPGLHETTIDAEGCAMGEVEMLDLYLKRTAECMEGVQKLPSPKFNTEQCEYLADKLKVVVRSASSCIEDHGPGSCVDVARQIETFKLMLERAKEIESLILGCSKDAWVQAAMTLTNMSEHVASIGFNLELCRVAFCKERGATGHSGRLTLDEVMAINDGEVRIVKEKALVDGDTLFRKVLSDLAQKSLSIEENELAIYLLQSLKKVEAVSPSVASGSPCYSVIDDVSLLGHLFKWVSGEPKRIGRGASAAVYKAMWLGTPVAKKTFEGRDNPDFLKEVEILGKLSHPNITSMFCCQKDRRSCSVVMELMDGDLHELMHERCEHSDSPPFSIFEAVDIMLQIGEGVNYLHQEGFIHRDLKSYNILVKSVLAAQSEVEVGYVRFKVADFGLSKTKSVSTTYSNQTVNTGTYRWMAPEVIGLDGRSQVSPSSQPRHPRKIDVYGFAMLCYEILTGDVPFPLETIPRRIKQKILNGDRPDLPDDCPVMLKALIEECWDKTPSKRPSFPTICSRLKYVKYLLMAGLSSIEDARDLTGGDLWQAETTIVNVEEAKHKIYVSCSIIQKSFAKQLCKDLEAALDHFAIFDDGGNSFLRSWEASKKCKVVMVVLSKEYLSSEWPMYELVEFLRAMKSENKSLVLIPLFYNISVDDLSEEVSYGNDITDWHRWIPNGSLARGKFYAAVQELRSFYGLSMTSFGNSEVKYRAAIVEGLVSYDRICEEASLQMASSCEKYSQEKMTSYLKPEPEYKIFLSYKGGDSAVERFVEQLDKNLEVLDQLVFCTRRVNCLPLGQKFAPLISEACRNCKVAVVVLSEKYLISKWPMKELVEFMRRVRDEDSNCIILPVFFKIQVEFLSEQSIEKNLRPEWNMLVKRNVRVKVQDLEEWTAAVRVLRSIDGLSSEHYGNSEVKFRDATVRAIQSALLRL